MKIYLIEDNVSIFEQIKLQFSSWNLEVEGPRDFKNVMEQFHAENHQMVIIDIQLPAFDGFHWCREIRAQSNVPIIFLSFVMLILFLWYLAMRDKRILEEKNFQQRSPTQDTIKAHYETLITTLNEKYTLLKSDYKEKDDELLAWVHEMKSPLTAMKLMFNGVENYELKGKLEKEWLRMNLLLDQQLHVTRIQTMEKDSRLEPISLRSIVVDEVKAFQPWCLEKGLGVELDSVNGEVITDKKWLAFIVRQYLSNAVKYSPPNSVIEIESAVSAQGHMLLKIRDYGQGIAAHDLPRVFRKTYTGSKGRESAVASGMGLYLAKQAADYLGLKLYLQLEAGNGTTAVIQFPLENEYAKMGM